jgi:DNA-3-methyladenine glycosylase II
MSTEIPVYTPPDVAAFRRRLAKVDPVLAGVIRAAGKYTLEPQIAHTPFHALASAITHQQLNGTAAMSIFNRFCGLYSADGKIADGKTALLEAELVLATSDEKLRSVGLSFAKIASIKDLATKTLAGIVPPYEILHTLADDDIVERITQVRGIGRWTVEMLLIFRLGRTDILPVDDYGVRKGYAIAFRKKELPTTKDLARYGEKWKPWRSVASWYLWRATDRKPGTAKKPGAAKARLKPAKSRKAR